MATRRDAHMLATFNAMQRLAERLFQFTNAHFTHLSTVTMMRAQRKRLQALMDFEIDQKALLWGVPE
ncbi:MAG: hypothetical protein JHC87_09045 [Thermoleophilaceae bacterium]|nr:hypothetical protein [Thermoleophilaceae bacterium]